MKEKIPQPAPVSRTLQEKARESKPASVADVLQAYKNGIVQQQAVEEEDELLQGKFETAQREELEDDELLQGKFETVQRDELEDDELLQGKFETAQREELEEDELLQGKFETTQREELEDDELLQGKFEPTQRQEVPNNTGLPDSLKAGVEQLSGLDMSDVKVHYNSSKPASLQAYAYTQGTDIHVAPGQEKHLGHEAWHVAQQKQGRVQPTTTVGGKPVNDNAGLESEADVMGGKAVQMKLEVNKNGAVDNSVAQKKSNVKQGYGFVDNRPELIMQRRAHTIRTTNVYIIPPIQFVLNDEQLQERITRAIRNAGFDPIGYMKNIVYYINELRAGHTPRLGIHHRVLFMDRMERVGTRMAQFAGVGMMGRIAHGRGIEEAGEMLIIGRAPMLGAIRNQVGDLTKDNLPNVLTARQDLKQIMGGSAAEITGIPGAEWLHQIGHQIGGDDAKANLMAGTHALNTAMIPIENRVQILLAQGNTVRYGVNFYYGEVVTQIGVIPFVNAVEITVSVNGMASVICTLRSQQETVDQYYIAQENVDQIFDYAQGI